MLEHGIITTSVSPYASPITLVTKRDKSKRFCVDYRRINEIIAPDVHPLPLIENILDKLSRAKYFSSADISSAYWQVEIDPSSRYTIKNGTYTPQIRNLDIINAIKPPFNQKTLQSFLGAVNVYNKFIPDYARLRTPLNHLLKKDTKWQWDEKCQQAFTALKESLTRKPVLHLYQDGLPCRLYCDASTQGIAGILKQVHPDGEIHPTQYYSRALRPHERNYTISELECLAIVESIEKFRIYLSGTKFTVYSDHQALQWLKTIKNPSGRLFRWSLRLSTYDYEIQYLKGTQQHEADLLSRNPFCGFISARTIKKHQPNITDTSVAVDVNGLHTIRRKGFPPIFLMFNSIPPELKNHYNPFPDVQKARQLASSRTQLKHERDKQRYDKGHQAPHFEIGDLVLVHLIDHVEQFAPLGYHLESTCRRWTPFTRGLSLVGRARAANSLVGSTIQHHLHGYLPSPPTIAKLQVRLARFVWGPEHTAWLPADVMARPVAIGDLDLATQLQLACLKGVQVALRGGRNGFDWLVNSSGGEEPWIHPPPDGTRLQPRRLRLLKLWEEASNILGLNHRAVPTAQLLDLPTIGGCRPSLGPSRGRGPPHRLADVAALGAFCRRLTSENAVGFGGESSSSSSLAAAVVLRGTATPFLNGLTTRSARRALDRPRLAATPIFRFIARWTPTIGPPPSRIDWASLRRCAFSGHEVDAAFKLALHALPHPAHPASDGPACPACGSIDRSLGHRYWCCRSIRPLIRERRQRAFRETVHINHA
ncbi:K02A2.6-like [Cordylochernes scorpioides]|uniref:K02A2.6-like n=1 Tax=Cordylochernes scorpioides TaxID=51811 RepID=A0ABY6L0X5_9ARAC|nr:K02A2.6-like [Cordylochernes scorpioides]